MARRLAWSNVRGGLIAIGVIVGVCVAILKFARVGALHGDRIHLYAVVGAARGVLKGSEVWLMGQKVGKVTGIRFRSPSESDTSTRVLVEMDVLAKYRDALHRDAVAEIRPGGSMIGAMVVNLSAGSASAPAIGDGDTVRARPQSDAESAMGQFSAVARELPAVVGNVKTIRSELETSGGSIGALIHDGAVQRAPLQSAMARARRLSQRLSQGRGSMGRIVDGEVGVRAQRVMARADSVRALVASTTTSLGRFRRDSTLVKEVAGIRDELADVRTALATSRGTAGRVAHDSAMASALGDVQREMTLLLADLKKHPLRYNPF